MKKSIRLYFGLEYWQFGVSTDDICSACISNTIAGNVSFGGDSRGGDTSVVRQMLSMIQHPWATIKLLVTDILRFDNFRNLGDPSSSNYFVGNLMFLNFGALGVLSHKWVMLLLPVLLTYVDL